MYQYILLYQFGHDTHQHLLWYIMDDGFEEIKVPFHRSAFGKVALLCNAHTHHLIKEVQNQCKRFHMAFANSKAILLDLGWAPSFWLIALIVLNLWRWVIFLNLALSDPKIEDGNPQISRHQIWSQAIVCTMCHIDGSKTFWVFLCQSNLTFEISCGSGCLQTDGYIKIRHTMDRIQKCQIYIMQFEYWEIFGFPQDTVFRNNAFMLEQDFKILSKRVVYLVTEPCRYLLDSGCL